MSDAGLCGEVMAEAGLMDGAWAQQQQQQQQQCDTSDRRESRAHRRASRSDKLRSAVQPQFPERSNFYPSQRSQPTRQT